MKKNIITSIIIAIFIVIASINLNAQEEVKIYKLKDTKAEYSVVVTPAVNNLGKENGKNAIGIVQKSGTVKEFNDIWTSMIAINNLDEFYELLIDAKNKQLECDSLYKDSKTIKTNIEKTIISNYHKFNVLLAGDYDNTWITNTNVTIYTTSGMSRVYIHFDNAEKDGKSIYPQSVTLSLRSTQLDNLIKIVEELK